LFVLAQWSTMQCWRTVDEREGRGRERTEERIEDRTEGKNTKDGKDCGGDERARKKVDGRSRRITSKRARRRRTFVFARKQFLRISKACLVIQ
jgi:hypothetical protein